MSALKELYHSLSTEDQKEITFISARNFLKNFISCLRSFKTNHPDFKNEEWHIIGDSCRSISKTTMQKIVYILDPDFSPKSSENLSNPNILIYDDHTLTGEQILGTIHKITQKYTEKINLVLVIPFMTQKSKSDIVAWSSNKISITIHTAETLIVEPIYEKWLWWYEHKMPDGVSIPHDILVDRFGIDRKIVDRLSTQKQLDLLTNELNENIGYYRTLYRWEEVIKK